MNHCRAIVACMLTLTLTGCSGNGDKPANLPKLFPIVVTVLQDGTPLEDAFVRLVPSDSKMPWSCGATTDTSGRAVIKTIGKFPGAPEGDYKVAVSKIEMPESQGNDLSDLNTKVDPKDSASTYLVDPKFANPTTTTFELHVGEGSSEAEFDVGPAVRVKQILR